ncbi:putative membrane protein YfcA [Flavobacterium arsenatis]|uniref:Probable membrane transporter protein n=1 Tax=Flavobacterium arsenatis TaxID=1484332 RepID=A0ABU1TTX0_9FLAO|nr:sulfite exporter TauE/SafE family protein [Flavobacterium arsenatis]MDR6969316.1 putative membrane protein YfcA [Flavobacterium arsenatis]
MDIFEIVGYILAVLVGISLGLIGSGGSILSVPILVYIMGVNPIFATAYSLFIVGSSALVGGIKKAINKEVDFKTVALFGIPSIFAVFLTRSYLVPNIPEVIFSLESFQFTKSIAVMVFFAIIMILSALKMMHSSATEKEHTKVIKNKYLKITLQGLMIGVVAGTVGAGGGFLIIPALVLLIRMPMKIAIGTSLFIVAVQSLIGFTGDLLHNSSMDWNLLLLFTLCSIIGIFIGNYLSKKISGDKLKVGFGWFVLVMGVYIIVKELFWDRK